MRKIHGLCDLLATTVLDVEIERERLGVDQARAMAPGRVEELVAENRVAQLGLGIPTRLRPPDAADEPGGQGRAANRDCCLIRL